MVLILDKRGWAFLLYRLFTSPCPAPTVGAKCRRGGNLTIWTWNGNCSAYCKCPCNAGYGLPSCYESGLASFLSGKQMQTSPGLLLCLCSPHKPNPYVTTKSKSMIGKSWMWNKWLLAIDAHTFCYPELEKKSFKVALLNVNKRVLNAETWNACWHAF